MNGDIAPISALASGVAAPNSAAAVSATRIAECLECMIRFELTLKGAGRRSGLRRGELFVPFTLQAASQPAGLLAT